MKLLKRVLIAIVILKTLLVLAFALLYPDNTIEVLNNSGATVSNVRILAITRTRAEGEKQEFIDSFHLEPNKSKKLNINSGDALLKVKYIIEEREYTIDCGYTSSSLSHILVIPTLGEEVKCVLESSIEN